MTPRYLGAEAVTPDSPAGQAPGHVQVVCPALHGVSVLCSWALNVHRPEIARDPPLLCDSKRLPVDNTLNQRTHQRLAEEAPCPPTACHGWDAQPGARSAPVDFRQVPAGLSVRLACKFLV